MERPSTSNSVIERGVDEILTKLKHNESEAAAKIKLAALRLRDTSRTWKDTPPPDVDRRASVDSMFALFRQACQL